MNASHRGGFSLLEVLLATSILLGAIIVLGELASIGRRSARAALDLSQAQLLCQTKMEELLAGIVPLEPQQNTPVEGEPGWFASVNIKPVAQQGLAALEVTVWREEAGQPAGRQFTLHRWIYDPNPTRFSDSDSSAGDSPIQQAAELEAMP
jgi:Tfp pilus assembly protein PilV